MAPPAAQESGKKSGREPEKKDSTSAATWSLTASRASAGARTPPTDVRTPTASAAAGAAASGGAAAAGVEWGVHDHANPFAALSGEGGATGAGLSRSPDTLRQPFGYDDLDTAGAQGSQRTAPRARRAPAAKHLLTTGTVLAASVPAASGTDSRAAAMRR